MSTPRTVGKPGVTLRRLKAGERAQLREWLLDAGQILWSMHRGPGKVFALEDERSGPGQDFAPLPDERRQA